MCTASILGGTSLFAAAQVNNAGAATLVLTVTALAIQSRAERKSSHG